ncbi:MAG: pyruvate dehydrogenase complex dihydrolipoamide acetyltransferase [Rickettsiales bacterium]
MPIEITMPALSPTMTEGNLAKWVKKEGDKVKAGDVIAEIETDKATMEVEAVDEGTLGKFVVPAGTEGVKVNAVIALLLEAGEDKKALDSWKPKEQPKAEKPTADSSQPTAKVDVAATMTASAVVAPVATKAPAAPLAPAVGSGLSAVGSGRVKASPLAKRAAAAKGIDLTGVVGSGPGGRIVMADIEAGVGRSGGGAVRRNPVEFVQVPNNSMRKVIARRLLESKQQVPHFYLTVAIEMDALMQVRAQLNAEVERKTAKGAAPAYKLSVNDMIIKATAMALRDKPSCNVSWYDDAIVQYNNVDVSVAVATDGGLITPIIRNADQKSLPQISAEMKDLAGRARANKLKPEEFQGGGFSISNLGMFGVSTFQAIINPPQACILAVGASETKLVKRGGDISEVQVMNATLSVDHRAVDGALGAEWLQIMKRYIENPILMFV